VKRSLFARWQTGFVTGVIVLLPAVGTLAIVKWLFGTVASLTDTLLFFLPRAWTHAADGRGEMHWYYSLAAFALGILLVSLVGLLTRYYVGKRFIAWLDGTMMNVPLLNKIYGTIKQVNEAFSAGKNTAFKTVVLVQFPREGLYSVGFITSEQHAEVQAKTHEKVVCVFVPTTPNPTSGFLVLAPEDKVIKLEMSVADAIRYIISLGSVSPEFAGSPAPPPPALAPATTVAPAPPEPRG
jgi:uncharacterized membrane protein